MNEQTLIGGRLKIIKTISRGDGVNLSLSEREILIDIFSKAIWNKTYMINGSAYCVTSVDHPTDQENSNYTVTFEVINE